MPSRSRPSATSTAATFAATVTITAAKSAERRPRQSLTMSKFLHRHLFSPSALYLLLRCCHHSQAVTVSLGRTKTTLQKLIEMNLRELGFLVVWGTMREELHNGYFEGVGFGGEEDGMKMVVEFSTTKKILQQKWLICAKKKMTAWVDPNWEIGF
ncbi:hypothetical protein ACFX13_044114 [Malus domestica]